MDRESLEQMLEEGLSLEAIGEREGKHPETIWHWVQKHGLKAANADRHRPRGGIDRATLETLVTDGLTIREIAAAVDRSYATVRHWLNAYDLKTKSRRGPRPRHPAAAGAPAEEQLVCELHGLTRHRRHGGRGYQCLQCRAAHVAERRRKVKRTLVDEAGGACSLCGYDRCIAALHFHHVDPQDKEFNLARRGAARSLDVRARRRASAFCCARTAMRKSRLG